MVVKVDLNESLQELSYDYGYLSNSVMKPDGSIKKAVCHCGATNCTGRLY